MKKPRLKWSKLSESFRLGSRRTVWLIQERMGHIDAPDLNIFPELERQVTSLIERAVPGCHWSGDCGRRIDRYDLLGIRVAGPELPGHGVEREAA